MDMDGLNSGEMEKRARIRTEKRQANAVLDRAEGVGEVLDRTKGREE
jgi:hypothetical protein